MGGDSGYTLRVCKQKEKNQNKSNRITIFSSLISSGLNRETGRTKEREEEGERKKDRGKRGREREKGKERNREAAQFWHKFLFFDCSLALVLLAQTWPWSSFPVIISK